jgi:hypothetical protein
LDRLAAAYQRPFHLPIKIEMTAEFASENRGVVDVRINLRFRRTSRKRSDKLFGCAFARYGLFEVG